jgi:hypothetical protein
MSFRADTFLNSLPEKVVAEADASSALMRDFCELSKRRALLSLPLDCSGRL